MSIANLDHSVAASVNLDATVPAPMTNVAEYGFEGRFEEWADDARYFEYSKAANPIGSGTHPGADRPVRARALHGRADRRGPAGPVEELGITTVRPPARRCWPTSCASAPASRSTPPQRHQSSCTTCSTGAASPPSTVTWWSGPRATS